MIKCLFLGHIISDTMKFCFLFFEVFIPYTVAFWILFGEDRTKNEREGQGPYDDWNKFNDLVYAIWSVRYLMFIIQKVPVPILNFKKVRRVFPSILLVSVQPLLIYYGARCFTDQKGLCKPQGGPRRSILYFTFYILTTISDDVGGHIQLGCAGEQ